MTWHLTSRHDVVFSHEKGDDKTEYRMTVFVGQKWPARKFIRQSPDNWFSSVISYELSPDKLHYSAYKNTNGGRQFYKTTTRRFRQYFSSDRFWTYENIFHPNLSFLVNFSADLTVISNLGLMLISWRLIHLLAQIYHCHQTRQTELLIL